MSAPLCTIREALAPDFLPDSEEDETLGPHESVEETPRVSEPQQPLGKPLLDFLVAYLRQLDWTIEYIWATYRGHAFEAKRGKRRYDIEVESLEIELAPEMREGLWKLKAAPRSGFLQSLFRRKHLDLDELKVLQLNLDAALLSANIAERPWHPED